MGCGHNMKNQGNQMKHNKVCFVETVSEKRVVSPHFYRFQFVREL